MVAEITSCDDEARLRAVEEAEIFLKPPRLRIEPVKTWGHTDAHGYPSQGFLLRSGPKGEEASILFSGDTGAPRQEELRTGEKVNEDLYAKGEKNLLAAVDEADIVIAHLSAAPLKELRMLSSLGSGSGGSVRAVNEYRELWEEAAAKATSTHRDVHARRGIAATKFLLNQVQFGFRCRPRKRGEDFSVSPFSDAEELRQQPERHLYLTGLIEIAERMAGRRGRPGLLLVGELREELGTFRTQVARRVREEFFGDAAEAGASALTTDIGLRIRLSRPRSHEVAGSSVLCSTYDLDNDLLDTERYHPPEEIHELCVKDEAVFYNCSLHDPRHQQGNYWVEAVERFNVFGD